VLSSHMLAAVEEWCTRVLWMDQGRVRADGPRDAVLAAYRKSAATATVEVA
jgi:lipopolysaccharide transport system ATP-binding protein